MKSCGLREESSGTAALALAGELADMDTGRFACALALMSTTIPSSAFAPICVLWSGLAMREPEGA